MCCSGEKSYKSKDRQYNGLKIRQSMTDKTLHRKLNVCAKKYIFWPVKKYLPVTTVQDGHHG
jgi:hypothetical protein